MNCRRCNRARRSCEIAAYGSLCEDCYVAVAVTQERPRLPIESPPIRDVAPGYVSNASLRHRAGMKREAV